MMATMSASFTASSMSWVTMHDRLAHGRLEGEQVVLQPRPHDRVDGAVRLVHQQDRRVGGERPGHAGTLLLAAGQRGGISVEQVEVEADERDQLVAAGVDAVLVPAEQFGYDADVAPHGAVREQTDLLDHVADAPAQLVGRERASGPRRAP